MIHIPGGSHRDDFGGLWKYLTFWNLWVQLLFCLVCLLNDFLGSDEVLHSKASRLQRIRDFYFATVAFPIGVFVGIMFWSLYLIDRELVFPEILDQFFPVYVNHMLHTTCIPLQIFELLMAYHIYPSKKAGMTTTGFFCFAYLAWVVLISVVNGYWIYPVFEVLPSPFRYIFMLFCSACGGTLYLLGDFFNHKFWAKAVKESEAEEISAKKKVKKSE